MSVSLLRHFHLHYCMFVFVVILHIGYRKAYIYYASIYGLRGLSHKNTINKTTASSKSVDITVI